MFRSKSCSLKRSIFVTMLAGLVVAGAISTPVSADSSSASTPVRVIVQGGDPSSVASVVTQSGGRVISRLDIVGGLAVEVPLTSVKQLMGEPGVRNVRPDAPVARHESRDDEKGSTSLSTAYPWALMAPPVWRGRSEDGQRNVGVAIIDTGIASLRDFGSEDGVSRIVARQQFGGTAGADVDNHGHGTAVAGVVAGNGGSSKGKYVGIAPSLNLISLRVGNDQGEAYVSDVLAAIAWAVQHKDEYNIRVLNLSLTSTRAETYRTSLLDFAVEYAWFNGLVVVVAAGNVGPDGVPYPPANDPYVITVGATDDKGTRSTADDELWSYSAAGKTQDGYAKPDVVAPGRRIVTALSSESSALAAALPDRLVGKNYIRLSGTSLSAGEVSGVVGQILEAHPRYRPDEVKWLLARTASSVKARGSGPQVGTGAGYPSVTRAVSFGGQLSRANLGLVPNTYLAQALARVVFDGVSWDGVSWDGVSWDGVSWDGVSWDGVSWDGVSWDGVSWDGVSWDGVSWDGVSWDGVSWDGVSWDGVTWDAFTRD